MLTRGQRVRLGLPPDPPPPYTELSTDIVRQAMRRTSREATKAAAISTLLTGAVAVPLFIFVDPLVAVIAVQALGSAVTWLVIRARRKRT